MTVERATLCYAFTHSSANHSGFYPRDGWEPISKRIRLFTKKEHSFSFLSHRKVQMLEWIFALMSSKSMGLQSKQEGKVRTWFRLPDPKCFNSFIGTFTGISLQSAEKCGEQQLPRLLASVRYPLPETDPKHRWNMQRTNARPFLPQCCRRCIVMSFWSGRRKLDGG